MLERTDYPEQAGDWPQAPPAAAQSPDAASRKALYRSFSAGERSLPIFSRAWWLDASAGADDWGVALVEHQGRVLASLPYAIERRLGFILLGQPPLTGMLGPWIRESGAKYARRLAQQKDLMEALIDQLPPYDHFEQHWHHSQTNWLPFHWRGFRQTTRYGYLLDDLSVPERLAADAASRKASARLEVVQAIPAREFHDHHCLTLAKQGRPSACGWEEFRRIHDACLAHGAGRTVAAYDAAGNLHAALFAVWDETSAYVPICSIDPDYPSHGAVSLLGREIVAYLADKTRRFDVEGSTHESLQRVFRRYGARPVPRFAVSRTPSKLLKTLLFLRDLKARP
ncbi:GNAT family N-acetyltransferase [Pseudomonas stutzeri]|nr:GNAT family N-acetyltransferase [Stutzerimonas stutzeri]